MADASENTVSSIRTLVRDGWDFIVPPAVRLALALAILLTFAPRLASVAGGYGGEVEVTRTQVGAAVETLEKLNLGSVLPIGALVVVVVTAYAANRLMALIAGVLPIRPVVDPIAAIPDASLLADVWLRLPDTRDGKELYDRVQSYASEQCADSHLWLDRRHRIEQKRAGSSGWCEFTRFAIVWTLMATVVGLGMSQPLSGQLTLLSLILMLLGGVLCAMMANHAQREQEAIVEEFRAARERLVRGERPRADQGTDAFRVVAERLEGVRARREGGWWELGATRPSLFKAFSGVRLVWPRFAQPTAAASLSSSASHHGTV